MRVFRARTGTDFLIGPHGSVSVLPSSLFRSATVTSQSKTGIRDQGGQPQLIPRGQTTRTGCSSQNRLLTPIP